MPMSWACGLTASCPARFQCVMGKCSCEPWNLVCVPTKKEVSTFHMSLVSQPQVALHTSVSFQCLLAFCCWCSLFLCWVSPSGTIWSLSLCQAGPIFMCIMIEQKWIALVFFLFGYFFSPASGKRPQRLPSILLSAMLHKIWNIKQVIYMV